MNVWFAGHDSQQAEAGGHSHHHEDHAHGSSEGLDSAVGVSLVLGFLFMLLIDQVKQQNLTHYVLFLLLLWTAEGPTLPQVPREGQAFKIGPRPSPTYYVHKN
jgi:hypothetical protein